MSKISVFKFNLNGQNTDNIINLITNYLTTRSFSYDEILKCYITGKPISDAKNIALSAGLSAVASIASGGATAVAMSNVQRGFEYYINGNDLIIKCYIYTSTSKSKNPIHQTFNNTQAGALYYADLKNNLFNDLKNYNVTLMNTEIEKIKDGSSKRVALIIFIILASMILISALLVFIILKL